jgi:hypothetical protein
MKRLLLLGVVMLASIPGLAKDYESFKPALIEAIDAPGGAVSGRLVGPAANLIAGTTKSTAPITLEVATLSSFKQEGCKRFRVALRQENVPTTSGALAAFAPIYTLNMCRDGTPPTEGMDLDAVGKALRASGRAGE